ncbi:MAG: glutamine amidotransferase [Fuerstiella sp.]|nr:glutamine amidotransferase [Fuerstiella sp.]
MNFSFGDLNFSFVPIWSWPFVFLCCVVMVGVVTLAYPRRIQHVSSGRRKLLLLMRYVTVLFLLFLMLKPSLVMTSENQRNYVVYVLWDASRSMATPDGPGSVTRYEVQRAFLNDAQRFLDRFGERVEIRYRAYSETLHSVGAGEMDQPQGEFTSLSNTLEDLQNDAASDDVAMVIMTGDGRQAAWGDDNRNPVQFARLLGKKNMPIYTWAIGTSDVTSSVMDVAVSELDIPRDVFVRNVVPVKVRVRANGVSGKSLQVRVLLEKRVSGRTTSTSMMVAPGDQQHRPVQEFICDGDSLEKLIELEFIPGVSGVFKVAVEVVPLADEVRKTNNRIETLIRVRKGGIRVAYFDQPRTESTYLRSITVSSRVQLEFQKLFLGRFADRNQFVENWFEPGEIDAFIIGDVPAEIFGRDRLRKIQRCCEAGAGLMMTGGFRNFGAGGYENHKISELFPVDLSGTTDQLTGLVRMVPTDTGLRHSVLQIAPPDINADRWRELPPLNQATVLKPLEGSLAQVLARTETGEPLLVAHEVAHGAGQSRVMVFGGDTTWRWCLQRDWGTMAQQRFWRQVIFWLTRIEQDDDGPVWITAEPQDVAPGQDVELRFGARDSQGLQITDAKYTVTVTRPDGTVESVLASRDRGAGLARFTQVDEPGDYRVGVQARVDGTSHGSAVARFLVNARDPELDNPSADPEMMRELATVSGGDFLSGAQLLQRLEDFANNGLPVQALRQDRRINLWDNWFSLMLFTVIMTCEWVVRKKSGLV